MECALLLRKQFTCLRRHRYEFLGVFKAVHDSPITFDLLQPVLDPSLVVFVLPVRLRAKSSDGLLLRLDAAGDVNDEIRRRDRGAEFGTHTAKLRAKEIDARHFVRGS